MEVEKRNHYSNFVKMDPLDMDDDGDVKMTRSVSIDSGVSFGCGSFDPFSGFSQEICEEEITPETNVWGQFGNVENFIDLHLR